MNTVPNESTCPKCGQPVSLNAFEGLCPACLLQAGFGTVTGDIGAEKLSAFIPPTPEELAKHFPQLEIIELLGRGGMGAVYKARQVHLDRIVALKILPPAVSQAPAFAERFVREARALAKLHHPNIVTLYESGQADDLFFFLMEFVDGVNLRQLLSTGTISSKDALAIVPQICDALQFAHDRGIVHRDIKPENILLSKSGQVKIADFGIAKIVAGDMAEVPSATTSPQETSQTEIGKVLGTPQYMAPEQLSHPLDVDNRADIYALGVVFYQMLTGELPAGKFEPPSHKVHIDVRLDEIVLRALQKQPELRYQQASVMKTQVETIVASPSVSSAPPGNTAPLSSGGTSLFLIALIRWFLVAFAVFTLTLLGGAYVTYAVLPKIYTASAQIQILPQGGVSDRVASAPDATAFQAEFQIIQSSDVLLPIIKDLNLDHLWAKRLHKTPPDALPPLDALSYLHSVLRLDLRRGTNIIEISVSDEVPAEAAQIANAVVDRYKTLRTTQDDQRTHRGLNALRDQVAQQQKVVDEKKAAMEALRQSLQQKGVDLTSPDDTAGEAELAAREKNLRSAQVDSNARQVLLKSLLNLPDDQLISTLKALGREPTDVDQLQTGIVQLESDLANLKADGFGPQHPRVVSLQAELTTKQKQLAGIVVGLRRALQVDADMAKSRVTLFQKQVDNLKAKYPHADVIGILLKTDLETAQQDLLAAREDSDARRVLLQSVASLPDDQLVATLKGLGRDPKITSDPAHPNPAEIAALRRAMQLDADMAQSRVPLLQAKLDDLKKQVATAPLSGLDPLRAAQRDLSEQENLLDALNLRLKQVSADEQLLEPSVRIVSRAEPPAYPSKPNTRLDLLLSAFAGIFLGLVIASALELILWSRRSSTARPIPAPSIPSAPASLASQRGKRLALAGAILQPASILLMIAAGFWQIHQFHALGTQGPTNLDAFGAALSQSVIASTTATVLFFVSLIFLSIALAVHRYRARWFFTFLTIYSWPLLILFPFGTVGALFFLIYCLTHRNEFSTQSDRPASPTAPSLSSGRSSRGISSLIGWRSHPGKIAAILSALLLLASIPAGMFIAVHMQHVVDTQGFLQREALAKPSAVAVAQMTSAAPTLAFGPDIDGLQAALELKPAGPTFTLGQPIDVLFHLRNISMKNIFLSGGSWRQDNADAVIVTDEQGHRIPVQHIWYSGITPIQRALISPHETTVFHSSGLAFLSEDADEKKVTHPVGNYVKIKPGRYTITYHLHFPDIFEGKAPQEEDWQGDLETDPVTVNIEAPATASTQSPSFGPIIERLIETKGTHHRALNLASGNFMEPSRGQPFVFNSDGADTLRKAGVDLYTGDTTMAPDNLNSLDFRFCSQLVPQGNDRPINLDEITPDQFALLLAQLKKFQSTLTATGVFGGASGFDLTKTEPDLRGTDPYLFVTRDGTAGLLQITGLNAQPLGVLIRYKLVKEDAPSSTAAPIPSAPHKSLQIQNYDALFTPPPTGSFGQLGHVMEIHASFNRQLAPGVPGVHYYSQIIGKDAGITRGDEIAVYGLPASFVAGSSWKGLVYPAGHMTFGNDRLVVYATTKEQAITLLESEDENDRKTLPP